MKRIVTTVLVALAVVLCGLFPPIFIYADSAAAKRAECAGVGIVNGNGTCGDNGVQLQNSITGFVNIFSAIIGVVAVIMVLVAGYRYITSGGDPSKASAAKNTLLYAIIGLAIVGLAQFIVHFVLNNV